MALASVGKTKTTPPSWQRWAQENLFSSLGNTILTIVTAGLIIWVISSFTIWAFTQAQWAVIPANFRILMVGPFPAEQMWRVWTLLGLVSLTAGVQWGTISRSLQLFKSNGVPVWPFVVASLTAIYFAATNIGFQSGLLVPISVIALFVGFFAARVAGSISSRAMTIVWVILFALALLTLSLDFGTGGVPTKAIGGLLLTLLLSVVGIVASFPIGVLLAIGRSSAVPAAWASAMTKGRRSSGRPRTTSLGKRNYRGRGRPVPSWSAIESI